MQVKIHNDMELQKLREETERMVGRQIRTPKDFDFLSEQIFEQLHQHISTSTLKRLWGYLPSNENPRTSTLDLLSQFVGCSDWEDFCRQVSDAHPEVADTDATDSSVPAFSPPEAKQPRRWMWANLMVAALILLLLAIGGIYTYSSSIHSDNPYLLKQGKTFATCEEYLRLFGITPTEYYWDQPLPHHAQIIVWGPTYQHPTWHNEGNPDSLFPTITEYWTPTNNTSNVTEEIMKLTNRQHYFTVNRTNELRITFMKNVIDTGYVFLGIYRVSDESDSTHIVWERVAEQLDLSRLDYLEQLRN